MLVLTLQLEKVLQIRLEWNDCVEGVGVNEEAGCYSRNGEETHGENHLLQKYLLLNHYHY